MPYTLKKPLHKKRLLHSKIRDLIFLELSLAGFSTFLLHEVVAGRHRACPSASLDKVIKKFLFKFLTISMIPFLFYLVKYFCSHICLF